MTGGPYRSQTSQFFTSGYGSSFLKGLPHPGQFRFLEICDIFMVDLKE